MPVSTATGLARVTVSAPQRRLDVALPEHAPLAELLPELLRHAGIGLPDAGQAHGGWGLRRGARRGPGGPAGGGPPVAARGYGDGVVGATIGGLALPYAFVGGLLVLGPPSVLVGSTALVLLAVIGAVGVGHGLRVFVGGITAGLLGVLGALLVLWQSPAGSAAALLALLVTGIAAFPLLAIRLRPLPLPRAPP